MANRRQNNVYQKQYRKSFPERLQLAAQDGYKRMDAMRTHAKTIQQRYAAGYYDVNPLDATRGVKGSARPINFVYRYYNIIIPFLTGRLGDLTITPRRGKKLAPFAYTFELAMEQVKDEIKLLKTYRRGVTQSLSTQMMFLTGLTPKGMFEYRGKTYQAGQPFCKEINFEDQRYDMNARHPDEMQFYGHVFTLPMEEIYDRSNFKNYAQVKPMFQAYGEEDFRKHANQDESQRSGTNSLYDMGLLMNLYLPHEGTVVTIPINSTQGTRIMRTVDRLPEDGPYDILRYTDNDALIGIPPVYTLLDLDEQLNMHARKMFENINDSKTILAYNQSAEQDANRISQTGNRGTCAVNDVSALKEITFGGLPAGSLEAAEYLRRNASEQAGNLDSVGGIRADSKTLGQEELKVGNAARPLDDMVSTVTNLAESVERKIAWYLYYLRGKAIPLEKVVEGVGSVEVQWDDDMREGDFLDLNFKMKVHSMQRVSPESSYQKLLQVVSQIIIPTLDISAKQGKMLDAGELVKLAGRYMDLPELDQVYAISEPQPAQPGAYQPMAGQNVKNPGQADGRLGIKGDQTASEFQKSKPDNAVA